MCLGKLKKEFFFVLLICWFELHKFIYMGQKGFSPHLKVIPNWNENYNKNLETKFILIIHFLMFTFLIKINFATI